LQSSSSAKENSAEAPDKSKRVYLYFFAAPGRIKIGISKNVQQRLAEVGSHLEAEPSVIGFVRGSIEFEQHVHRELKAFRIRGEWFRDCRKVRNIIKNILAGDTLGFEKTVPLAQSKFQASSAVSNAFGKVCKTLWPVKTAENLASRVGCSVRAAAYEISGEREPCARSIAVVVNAIIPEKGR